MEEQPQKIQNYDSNYISGFDKSKLIWIIFSVVIFIGLIITSYLIFTYFSTSDFWDNSEIIIADGEESQKIIQDIAEMKKCLEMENFDLDCNLLFSNPDIEEKCEKIENLKDECFYKIAMMNIRLDLCWKIENDDLKRECEMEVNNMPINVPQDDDRFYPGQYAI